MRADISLDDRWISVEEISQLTDLSNKKVQFLIKKRPVYEKEVIGMLNALFPGVNFSRPYITPQVLNNDTNGKTECTMTNQDYRTKIEEIKGRIQNRNETLLHSYGQRIKSSYASTNSSSFFILAITPLPWLPN